MKRTLFDHWSMVPDSWMAPFSYFSFEGDPKMVSSDDGSFLYDPVTLMMAQSMRYSFGGSLEVNSWYRSLLLNSVTPGAVPLSEHPQGRAIDFSTRGRNRASMFRAAKEAGFTSFGFYNTFIHVGRSGRQWFGSQEAKQVWEPILRQTRVTTL